MKINFNSLTSLPTKSIRQILDYAKSLSINIKIVNATGGPCGGKTSIMVHIKRHFTELGWFVVLLPEAATIVRGAGFKAETGVISGYYAQQSIVSVNEFLFYQAIVNAVNSGQTKILIVRDRTALDGAAYMDSPEEFEALMTEMGSGIQETVNSAALTIHLQSLAVGMPDLYDDLKTGNPERFEDAKQAAETDQRTLDVYHRYSVQVRVIKNDSTNFDDKINRTLRLIEKSLGGKLYQTERAFIMSNEVADEWVLRINYEHLSNSTIEQFYLNDVRFRRETFRNGENVYSRTMKFATPKNNVRVREDSHISSEEYYNARKKVNPRMISQKTRKILQSHQGRFKADKFTDGKLPGCVRMEIESYEDEDAIPKFRDDDNVMEVTGLEEYSNSAICQDIVPVIKFRYKHPA